MHTAPGDLGLDVWFRVSGCFSFLGPVCLFCVFFFACFLLFVFSCKCQCKWLPGKTCLQNDLLCVERDLKCTYSVLCCIVGQYCILKKGDCPENFHEGFIYWDDAAAWFGGRDTRQSSKGQLLFSRRCHSVRCGLESSQLKLPLIKQVTIARV